MLISHDDVSVSAARAVWIARVPVRVSEGWQRAGWLTERGTLGAAWTARVS